MTGPLHSGLLYPPGPGAPGHQCRLFALEDSNPNDPGIAPRPVSPKGEGGHANICRFARWSAASSLRPITGAASTDGQVVTMALHPTRTFVLGVTLQEARSTCRAIDLPTAQARTIQSHSGGAMRGYGGPGLVVIVTRTAGDAMRAERPGPATAQALTNITVIKSCGGDVRYL